MSFLSRIFGGGGRKQAAAIASADPIDAFWVWWREASVELAKAYDDESDGPSEALIEAISERVHAIDEGLAWETGPGRKSDHHFALSAEGDAALRVLTQRWLSRAPQPSKSWEYYASRQKSGGNPRKTLTIDGRTFDYGDFKLGLEVDDTRAVVNAVVYHPLFAELAEEHRLQPTFLVLDDLLGEDEVTSWIGSVDAVAEEPDGAKPSTALLEAVRELRSSWDDEKVSLLKGNHPDGSPLFALMRLGLKRLDHLLHDHHLELVFQLREPTEHGLTVNEEGEELNALEEGLCAELGPRAIWIGHETYGGKRILHLHADASPAIQDAVLRYCEAHGDWTTELTVKHDPTWAILRRY